MWRVHESRVRQGLGATAADWASQNNDTDRNVRYNIPIAWTLYEMMTGSKQKIVTMSPL